MTRVPSFGWTLCRALLACAFLSLLLSTRPVFAVEPSEILRDPVLEARARVLSKGLRCVVCRNQSIDDSNAGVARDLRVALRERISAGDTDEQAVQYLVDRFGTYILLKPPLQATTYLLWIGPLLMLLMAGFGFRTIWKKSADAPSVSDELSLDDRALISKILNQKDR